MSRFHYVTLQAWSNQLPYLTYSQENINKNELIKPTNVKSLFWSSHGGRTLLPLFLYKHLLSRTSIRLRESSFQRDIVLMCKTTESGGLVVTSRTLIREVPGSISGASYLGGGYVVVLHHQADAGVDPIWPQPGVVAYPCKPSDLVARYRGWFEVVGLAAHDQ